MDEDGDTLSISVQDDLGGSLYVASDLASDSTVTFAASGLVPGAHTLTVTVDDGREGGQTVATRAYIINGAPTTPVITIEPEVPTTGNDMVAQLTTASVDSDFPGQVAYEWSWRRGDTTYDNGTTFPAWCPPRSRKTARPGTSRPRSMRCSKRAESSCACQRATR